jgi:FtsP/CotA-like multicopper oxidase with cupredoxin domain
VRAGGACRTRTLGAVCGPQAARSAALSSPLSPRRENFVPLSDPIWCDTAIVPRNGSITFRSRFLDFTGKYMLHCHMMNHEDLGMMQVVEVYADNQ